jgi:RNA polymerase sigma factor (sigma-70 family)
MGGDESMPDSRRAEGEENNATNAAQTHAERVQELYRQHGTALLAMLRGRVGSMEEARDVAQEAFMKVLALDSPGTVRFLEGYLWRTAAHIATDRARRRNYRDAQAPALMAETESSSPSPEPALITRERLAICSKALAELPAPCLMAVRLRVIDGLSFKEIAERMGINISTAMRYVTRAAEHCQRAVDKEEQTKGSDV